MGRKRAKTPHVHVEILQNGTLVDRSEKPVSRRGEVTLTSERGADLTLPFYPLPAKKLQLLEIQNGGVFLTPPAGWSGFYVKNGTPHSTDDPAGTEGFGPLRAGDYGTLVHGDLRLLVKVGPPSSEAAKETGPPRALRGGFLSHFFRDSIEGKALAGGALMAAVVVGGVAAGLSKRPHGKPDRLAELRPEYILPFVDSKHLETAPEALQGNLRQEAYLGSVLGYYRSFAAMLGGREHYDKSFMFPDSVARYRRIHREQDKTIEAAIETQKKTDRKLAETKGTAVLAVPAVKGETAAGGLLRLRDKLQIAQKAFEKRLSLRREVTPAFRKDPPYDFENYKNPSAARRNSKANEKLAQIKVLDESEPEKEMYARAETLAEKAATYRGKLKQSRARRAKLQPTKARPLGLPAGASFASFATEPLLGKPGKLGMIEASRYGEKRGKKKIKEPLIGELNPDLVEKFIREKRFQLRLCYELALRRNESARGAMEWKWRITSRGRVEDLALLQSEIQDRKMAACIREKLARWRFPRPKRGSVQVRYPFRFSPSKG